MTENEPIFHWKKCPSYCKTDSVLKSSILGMIYAARRSAIFRIATISQRDIFTNAQRKSFIEKHDEEFVPLFQQVPATVIQIVVNVIQNMFTDMDAFVDQVFRFFDAPKLNEIDPSNIQEKGAQYNGDFFAALTFPALFFYFQTHEFSDLGAAFLRKAIELNRNRLLMSLLAAYFDSFPRFIGLVSDRFIELASGRQISVFLAFKESLALAFGELTKHHKDLIEKLAEIDMPFLCHFFFTNYFPPRIRCVFGNCEEDDPEGIGKEICNIFSYCANHYSSPHVKVLLGAMMSVQHFRAHSLSYKGDICLPTIQMVISGLETKMLYDLFLSAGFIRQRTKLASMVVPNEQANSILPGYVQFSHRKFLANKEQKNLPIIFPDVKRFVKDEANEELSRSYAQLKKVAREEGQSILDVLDHPKSMRVKRQVSSLPIAKSEAFRKFIQQKLEKKTQKSQIEFEKFIGRISTQQELKNIEGDFDKDAEMYIRTAARDFMEKKCIPNGYVVPENVTVTLKPGIEFLCQRYSVMNTKPEELVVFRQKNTMKDTTIEPMLTIVNPDEVCPTFALEFMLSIINEWKSESVELTSLLHKFLVAKRNESLLASHFTNYRMNKLVRYAVSTFRRLNRARTGVLFTHMTRLFREIDEVNSHYYDGSAEMFAGFVADSILISGADQAILCLVWFSRLSLVCPEYIALMDEHTRRLWSAATGQVLAIVREKDTELASLVDTSINTIPTLE